MTKPAVVVEIQNASGASAPPPARIRRWVRMAVNGKAHGELTVRIVDEDESAALNIRYRARRGATNVLAFPAGAVGEISGEGPLPAGDLVVCAQVVAREADAQGKPHESHWAHIVIHGALHLAGYDHETDSGAARMQARERELLATLGLADPYADDGAPCKRRPRTAT